MKTKLMKLNLSVIFVFLILFTFGQEKAVDAKGIGVNRDDALQDALRNAIGQAVGVSIASESQVENFVMLKDAISTNTRGYISGYDVLSETKLQNGYEMIVSARVSLAPLQADAQLLARQIGGVRFLVMYDKRMVDQQAIPNLDYTVNRINSFLSEKNYRYIDRSRFERLQEEAFIIMKDTDTSTMSFVQRLGIMSGAQFIILIENIHINTRLEHFDTRSAAQVVIEAKVYDNCTAEGLGTVMLESGWKNSGASASPVFSGIDEAIQNGFQKVMSTFNSYVGDWVNNGTPYELRFYQIGTFRDFRDLRNKIRESSDFGGQLEITSVNNYTKLNVTFKSLPDDVAFDILDYADVIPAFKDKMLDVLMIYGRQISFSPRNIIIPEVESMKEYSNQ